MPPHRSRSSVAPRSPSRRAAGPAPRFTGGADTRGNANTAPLPDRRSALGVMRTARKGLAMIVVSLAFLSSMAYLLPNSAALASSPMSSSPMSSSPVSSSPVSSNMGGAPVQSMAQVPSTVAATVLARDDYSVTSKPKPQPKPQPKPPASPPASVFTTARAASLVPSTSSASLQWPVPGGTKLASGYGPRSCSGCSSFHRGADFSAPSGSPAWAMAHGVVTVASPGAGPFGVHVMVQHLIEGELVTTLYAHMLTGSLAVQVGDTVAAGQPVGAVGCTGTCSGTHLHFEIRPGGGAGTDPVAWLNARLS